MKKFLLSALVAAALVISPQLYAWEVSLDEHIGGAIYEESEDTVESTWDAFYTKTTLCLSDYDNKDIEGDVRFGVSLSSESTETWDISGVEYQTNDMGFWGMDTGLDIGWAFLVSMGDDTELALTPLAGYRWRFIRFTREDFTILNTITIRETVDEDYNLHFLDLGGRIGVELSEKFEIFAKPVFGIAVYNSADNSSLGKIEGDGGFLFNLDTGVNYSPADNMILGLMFNCEIQRLEGGEDGNIIWPDNSLDTYGVTASLKYRF